MERNFWLRVAAPTIGQPGVARADTCPTTAEGKDDDQRTPRAARTHSTQTHPETLHRIARIASQTQGNTHKQHPNPLYDVVDYQHTLRDTQDAR